jgi:hypothetical protein
MVRGIEIAHEILETGKENIEKVKDRFPDTIFDFVYGNVCDYKIDSEDTVFYFFNPFGEDTLRKVLNNIKLESIGRTKKYTLVYINPIHAFVFEETDFKVVKEFKSGKYTEAVIYVNA